MILTEKHYKCISLYMDENKNISEIAREIGVDRRSIHRWFDDEDFKRELDKHAQKIKNRCNTYFVQKLPYALDKLWKLTDSKDQRTAKAALTEFIDRSLGKVSTNISVENTSAKEDYNIEDALKRITEKAKVESNDASEQGKSINAHKTDMKLVG